MRKKITLRSVEAMKPGDVLADTETKGFIARCLPSGAVSYGLRYRDRKTQKRHWIRLGLQGEVTPDQARNSALAYQGDVAREGNPLESKRIIADKAKGKDTVAHVLKEFVRRYVNGSAKLRSGKDVAKIFERVVVPAIGTRSIYDLKRSEIVAMLDKIEDQRGPVMADRVLAHVRKAFNWEMTRNDDFLNPIVRGMSRTKPLDRARDRKLSDDEIRQIWEASATVNPAFRDIVRVLLLTGQRREEIAAMEWAWIDDKILEIPASRYKTGVSHIVPLTPAVLAIIKERPRLKDAEHVFTTTGKSPFQGFSKAKAALDTAINANRLKQGLGEIPDWRLHDLRRTARSIMSAAGVPGDVSERVLGHLPPGVRRTYDRHDYLAEKRDALERLGAAIDRILNPPSSNVVEIGKAKSANGRTTSAITS